jgi:hypothetical protein
MSGDDRATVITLRSPRAENLAATERDPADWTVDQAVQAVTRFLPADAQLTATATPEAEAAELERRCASEALAALFGEDGDCQAAFVMPTPLTVSYITLLLGGDETAAGAGNPCDGLPEWGQQSGARMESALALLGEIAGIDDSAADAPEQLRAKSGSFAELAAAQEGGSVPVRGARANEQLTLAFNGFATAVSNAAAGLEQDNDELLTQALAELDSARALFDAANALVLSALQRCDLIAEE